MLVGVSIYVCTNMQLCINLCYVLYSQPTKNWNELIEFVYVRTYLIRKITDLIWNIEETLFFFPLGMDTDIAASRIDISSFLWLETYNFLVLHALHNSHVTLVFETSSLSSLVGYITTLVWPVVSNLLFLNSLELAFYLGLSRF